MPTKGRPATPPGRRCAAFAVQIACRAAGLPSAAKLRRWARAAAPGACEVTLRLVGAAEGRRLNLRYRGIDSATNVLSFGYSGGGTRSPLHGDIVLCHPVLAREAREQAKTLVAHYAHLVVHGMLHLRGHDHRRVAERARMERAEKRILSRLGVRDPYEAPAVAAR